jgi:signal transduction histidine kinase
MEEFYSDTQDYFYYLLLCGLILGLILMAGFYNAFMYYYNREKAFIYYAFMQLFMVLVLVFYTGLVTDSSYTMTVYNLFSLLVAFFATLFAREFFKTSLHVPKLDMLLRFYLLLLVLDMLYLILTGQSMVSILRLYSIFGFVYIVIGFYRLRQGFTPAKFFLIGWGALILSLFFIEYLGGDFWISPLLLGSSIEAILLAIALAYKIKLIQNEKEQQKELLIHQSKLASMGEMIGNIAHQWRQPLTYLSYSFMNLKDAQKHGELDEKYLHKKVDEATIQLEFMSQTIDDFKNFYAPNREKELFSLAKAMNETLEIMKNTLESNKIDIELKIQEDLVIENYKNEYKQVVLNLLSNAKDALVQRAVKHPKITINIDKNRLTISDNAGGIEAKILPHIFEPYFSTKDGNSGIGLYMSKMIVERSMGGELRVSNGVDGAIFDVKI